MYARALGSYFCSGDIKGFKQYCYVAGRAYLESAKYDGGETFATAHSFLIAIFSDNRELIGEFAKVTTAELRLHQNNPRAIESDIHLIQLALKGEDAAMQARVKLLRQQPYGDGRMCRVYRNFSYFLQVETRMLSSD